MSPDEEAPRVGHIEVPRSARYAALGGSGPQVRELWVVLHGYRQLAPRFVRRFGGLAGPARLIAAPEALNRFYLGDTPGRHGPESRVGATWMTREDRLTEIRDYVRYLDRLHRHLRAGLSEEVRTVGLGFSQGCHTLARWAALGDVDFQALIFWGEVLPPDLDLEAARGGFGTARLLSVQGRLDGHLTEELLARQARQMVGIGRQMEVRWHEGGHRLEASTLAEIEAVLAKG